MGFSAGETAFKAGSQIASGNERDKLELANAGIADQQAKSEMAAGAYNTNNVRLKGKQIMGQQIAAIGANNLQQRGTPSQVVASSAQANERDALMTQNNALRRAWGFEVQGESDRIQGNLAQRGGMLSGIGSLIEGGGSMYKNYYKDNPEEA